MWPRNNMRQGVWARTGATTKGQPVRISMEMQYHRRAQFGYQYERWQRADSIMQNMFSALHKNARRRSGLKTSWTKASRVSDVDTGPRRWPVAG